MIAFLLTNWWIYIPIVLVLLFLTRQTNQNIMRTKRAKELNALPPEQQQNARLTTHKRPTGKLERITAKLGLRGILNYLFHQK